MQVAVENGLPGGFAVIGAVIETRDGRVRGLQFRRKLLRQAMGRSPFIGGELAEGGDMAPGDDEGVARADRKAVAEGDAGAVMGDDPVRGQPAERTGRIHGNEDNTGSPGRKAGNRTADRESRNANSARDAQKHRQHSTLKRERR